MVSLFRRDPQRQLEKENRKFRERKRKELQRQRSLEYEPMKISGKTKR